MPGLSAEECAQTADLSSLADEVVVFGPGGMTAAHRTGEYIRVGELDRFVEASAEIVRQGVVLA